MKTSEKGIELIKSFESLHDGNLKLIGLQPKMCPAGIWTEGFGHAMRDEHGNFIKGIANKSLAYSRITIHNEEEAMKVLVRDLVIYETIVARMVKRPLTVNENDSLVSYTYNTGGSSTLWELINHGASEKVIRDWFEKHYITGDGVVLAGLVKRRKAEADLFFKK